MELIIALLFWSVWYGYKYFRRLKNKGNQIESTSLNPEIDYVEAEIIEAIRKATCDFCDGNSFVPGRTNERMPCPKCSREKKIS
ncbi:hypothetical protein AB4114_11160 [Paenibacillus sp. 2RAB27]|uniref:hypothetical protein n=1 Tax=Paenibacillus sp. 2RAB27 TaxID=3232991 RepID=UPI003F9610DE